MSWNTAPERKKRRKVKPQSRQEHLMRKRSRHGCTTRAGQQPKTACNTNMICREEVRGEGERPGGDPATRARTGSGKGVGTTPLHPPRSLVLGCYLCPWVPPLCLGATFEPPHEGGGWDDDGGGDEDTENNYSQQPGPSPFTPRDGISCSGQPHTSTISM